MILQEILEGIGLGVLLILVCAIGIRKGAVGMVHSAGIGALRCLPLFCYDLIKAVSTGEMGTGETVLRQKSAGQITAESCLAIHIDRLVPL